MHFHDLLAARGLDAHSVIVLRHRPVEAKLRAALPWLAAERPDLFNAYQQTHGPKLQNALVGASHVASFIGHEPGKAVFVGLYSIRSARPITSDEFWAIPEHGELKRYDMLGFRPSEPAETTLHFDLAIEDFYSEWSGKLVISWPPPERSWWRRAHRNRFAILAVHEESVLVPRLPNWTDMVLSWEQLGLLPRSWREALSQWRGVYFIFDAASGQGYIGSAYGQENLLGRWRNYASSGHAGNKLLRGRSPESFSFSILQRVSPDLDAQEVVAIENSWKDRLHTRAPAGLNDN